MSSGEDKSTIVLDTFQLILAELKFFKANFFQLWGVGSTSWHMLTRQTRWQARTAKHFLSVFRSKTNDYPDSEPVKGETRTFEILTKMKPKFKSQLIWIERFSLKPAESLDSKAIGHKR